MVPLPFRGLPERVVQSSPDSEPARQTLPALRFSRGRRGMNPYGSRDSALSRRRPCNSDRRRDRPSPLGRRVEKRNPHCAPCVLSICPKGEKNESQNMDNYRRAGVNSIERVRTIESYPGGVQWSEGSL